MKNERRLTKDYDEGQKDHFNDFSHSFTFFKCFCGEKLTAKEWSSNLRELPRMKNERRLTKVFGEGNKDHFHSFTLSLFSCAFVVKS
jgi:hypothetical protein